MNMPRLYSPIYDAIANGELNPNDYLYLRSSEGVIMLVVIPKPNLLAKINLWLNGYKFILSGSEAIRLYKDCYSSEDFCQTLASF